MSGREQQSNPLTNYLESSSEVGRQLSWHAYLYALLGFVAVVALGVGLFLLFA
jgi:hypothetical protein